ncbi:14386_t:CDS:2, partial [Racocetra persica]
MYHPIIAFHMVEKPRIYKTKKKNQVAINEGNYNSSSQQIKHAILIKIIEKITPFLIDNQMVLDIGIDGDLNSNKILGEEKIIYKIFADLKHKAKLKLLEQPIMKYYIKYIYAAIARCRNSTVDNPTDNNLFFIQTEEDLIPYSYYIQESIQNHTYIPSFANLFKNFGNAFLYNGYYCFKHRFATGLCLLCGFYLHHDLNNLIPNSNFKNHISNHITNKLLIDAILDEIFKLPSYQEIQRESIQSFISGQDTLALLRTVYDLVKQGIPATVLFATSDQSPEIVKKIFAEIVSGIIDDWSKLDSLKSEFFLILLLLLTATCHQQSTRDLATILYRSLLNIIRSFIVYQLEIEMEECAIIYCATLSDCNQIENILLEQFMATNAFGIGINVDDVRLVLHTTFPISLDNFVQEIGRAGQDHMQAKQ